jgi:hypothetical protein
VTIDEGPRRFNPGPMLAALEAEGAVYVVIGGTAAAIHGARHVTFDLDITPDREIANLDRVAAALRRMNAHLYGMQPDVEKSFHLNGKMLAAGSAWKFVTDHGELDISLDPDGTHGFSDLRRGAVRTDIHGLQILVASLEDVIRSKEAAGRPRDRRDLPELRRTLELSRERERE